MARNISEENSQASKAFLAYMSHELRAPTSIIIGYSELIAENMPQTAGEDFKSWFNTIRRNAESLLRLINSNLDIAKVDAGKINLELSKVDLINLIHNVIYDFQVQANSKNITLDMDREKYGNLEILTDPYHLRQVLVNMFSNAVKFTNNGGKVSSTVYVHNNEIIIKICDTGIGMTSEQAENIFRPYSQANKHISKQFGGTGLGLVLAKKITQTLGGDLRLTETSPGKGSCFEIRLLNKVSDQDSGTDIKTDIETELSK